MHISRISFRGFKNLEGDFELANGLNLLIFPNGWGKTNFLEAIDYISSLKSFRQIPDLELFNWARKNEKGNEFVKIQLDISGEKKKQLQVVISDIVNGQNNTGSQTKSKKTFVNGAATTPQKFKSSFETILYSPHNADIVSSSPETRRNEFDRYITEFDEKYSKQLNEYKFIIRSRNKLLQKIRIANAQAVELDYWNKRMIELGQEIIEKRVVFLHKTKKMLTDYAEEIFNPGLVINYESKSLQNSEIILRDKIEENIEKEIQAGLSLYGPHRDNFIFSLNGQPLRKFGSRGQQRLAGLCLIFTLYNYYNKKLGRYPFLLLDDIMSELDDTHRRRIEAILLDRIKSQLFITSSEEKYFTSDFIRKCNLMSTHTIP